jgi:hypothetical protein
MMTSIYTSKEANPLQEKHVDLLLDRCLILCGNIGNIWPSFLSKENHDDEGSGLYDLTGGDKIV